MKSNNWYEKMMKEHLKKLAKDYIKMEERLNRDLINAIELSNKSTEQIMKNKKYKVQIPKGMKVKRELWPTTNNDQVVVEFESIKKELPKTWDEYWNNNEVPLRYKTQYGVEFEALKKLLQLRDHYNDGWVPNWNQGYVYKFCIEIVCDKIRATKSCKAQNILSFSDVDVRDEFLKNFAQLINEAKPLL